MQTHDHSFKRMSYKNITSATSKYPGFINAKTGKPCTPIKEDELEAILDRLDRMAQDVEQVCDAIVKLLELDLGNYNDLVCKTSGLYYIVKHTRITLYKLYWLLKCV